MLVVRLKRYLLPSFCCNALSYWNGCGINVSLHSIFLRIFLVFIFLLSTFIFSLFFSFFFTSCHRRLLCIFDYARRTASSLFFLHFQDKENIENMLQNKLDYNHGYVPSHSSLNWLAFVFYKQKAEETKNHYQLQPTSRLTRCTRFLASFAFAIHFSVRKYSYRCTINEVISFVINLNWYEERKQNFPTNWKMKKWSFGKVYCFNLECHEEQTLLHWNRLRDFIQL